MSAPGLTAIVADVRERNLGELVRLLAAVHADFADLRFDLQQQCRELEQAKAQLVEMARRLDNYAVERRRAE